MDVHFLGTRGNIAPSAARHRRHSGILIDGALLLDCGEAGYVSRYRPRCTLLTHLHADHACFLQARTPPAAPRTYAPEGLAGQPLRVLRPGRWLHLDGWRVTAIATAHAVERPSQAYRVSDARVALLYTGDLLDIDRTRPQLLTADLVVTDGSFIRHGGLTRIDPVTGRRFGHAGLPELIALFARFTSDIVITHLGAWFFRDPRRARVQLANLGREHGVRVRIAWDGLHLRL